MRASQVAGLQVRLQASGVDWCVVGGWGVDALRGVTTREHKDLDVLLSLAELPRTMTLLSDDGFRLAYTWSESRGIPGHHRLLGEPLPSAFVLTHADGREVDVHVHDSSADGIVCLWDTDRLLTPADLEATGSVDGVHVRCMTAPMQLTCHQGYDLPPAHAADVRLLQQMVAPHLD